MLMTQGATVMERPTVVRVRTVSASNFSRRLIWVVLFASPSELLLPKNLCCLQQRVGALPTPIGWTWVEVKNRLINKSPDAIIEHFLDLRRKWIALDVVTNGV